MELKPLPDRLSVCKLKSADQIPADLPLYFVGQTDEELSLVCPTDRVPAGNLAQDDGWRAFRIQGMLDFSLIGILAKLSSILAEHEIGIFAVSTYNTDYILTREAQFQNALDCLAEAGYTVVN